MWHNGSLMYNHSIVSLEEITSGSDLFCLTNTSACCRHTHTGSGPVGFWHFPNGDIVPNMQSGVNVDRGPSYVALTYSTGSTPPREFPPGLYSCVIPVSNHKNVTLFAGIYQSGRGTKGSHLNTSIILSMHYYRLS